MRLTKRSLSSALFPALLLCIAGLALTGCGQKGPLLLPESTSQPAGASGNRAPESERDEEDDSAPGSSRDSATDPDPADGASDGG